jgi:aldose 1-epimerase
VNAPVLTSHDQTLTFDPDLGGRITSWTVNGTEVLTGVGDHPVEHGMYPMAPWAGRLRDNRITVAQREMWGITGAVDYVPAITYTPWAIHGTCYVAPVDSWDVRDSAITMRQRIPDWPATLVTEWRVDGLRTESRLTVEADAPTPALLGWHPWFRRVIDGDDATWSLTGELALRDGAFATGEWRPWVNGAHHVDDAFHVPDGRVIVAWGERTLTIRNSDAWFVVFDERPEAVCVEPQNGPPNAFDMPLGGNPPVARPGAPRTMSTTWEWS